MVVNSGDISSNIKAHLQNVKQHSPSQMMPAIFISQSSPYTCWSLQLTLPVLPFLSLKTKGVRESLIIYVPLNTLTVRSQTITAASAYSKD